MCTNKRGLYRQPEQLVYIRRLKHIIMIIINEVNLSSVTFVHL